MKLTTSNKTIEIQKTGNNTETMEQIKYEFSNSVKWQTTSEISVAHFYKFNTVPISKLTISFINIDSREMKTWYK